MFNGTENRLWNSIGFYDTMKYNIILFYIFFFCLAFLRKGNRIDDLDDDDDGDGVLFYDEINTQRSIQLVAVIFFPLSLSFSRWHLVHEIVSRSSGNRWHVYTTNK